MKSDLILKIDIKLDYEFLLIMRITVVQMIVIYEYDDHILMFEIYVDHPCVLIEEQL